MGGRGGNKLIEEPDLTGNSAESGSYVFTDFICFPREPSDGQFLHPFRRLPRLSRQ